MCSPVNILRKILKKIQNRLGYAVFQSTRVTNDAYGWRPEEKPRR